MLLIDLVVAVVCLPVCRNGGVCVSVNVCQCADGFEGDVCERSLNTNGNGDGGLDVNVVYIVVVVGVVAVRHHLISPLLISSLLIVCSWYC